MSKRHLKTLTVPNTWPINRKESKFTLRPNPGNQSREYCMPITTLMKTTLEGKIQTKKESRKMLKEKEVLVDGKRRTDYRYPIGLMDVLTLKDLKKNYRVILTNKGKLNIQEIDDKEAKLKLCRITGKRNQKKGKIQIITNDGRTILTDKKDFKIGQTLLITIPEQEIKEVIKLEKGVLVYLIGGRHIGKKGVIEEITSELITLKTENGEIKTNQKFALALGKGKPLIKVAE